MTIFTRIPSVKQREPSLWSKIANLCRVNESVAHEPRPGYIFKTLKEKNGKNEPIWGLQKHHLEINYPDKKLSIFSQKIGQN